MILQIHLWFITELASKSKKLKMVFIEKAIFFLYTYISECTERLSEDGR